MKASSVNTLLFPGIRLADLLRFGWQGIHPKTYVALFSTEEDRYQTSFAWIDSHEPVHRYIKAENSGDFSIFYLINNAWLKFFGDASEKIIQSGEKYRAKHPDKPLNIFYLPPSINN